MDVFVYIGVEPRADAELGEASLVLKIQLKTKTLEVVAHHNDADIVVSCQALERQLTGAKASQNGVNMGVQVLGFQNTTVNLPVCKPLFLVRPFRLPIIALRPFLIRFGAESVCDLVGRALSLNSKVGILAIGLRFQGHKRQILLKL